VAWAVGQLRREHATIAGLARRLAVSWWALWRAIKPVLEDLAGDESRFTGVTSLGVDEHIWHHGDRRVRGPKELTGMVDLTRDDAGRVHARLLDLVPGRSKKAYADWLEARGADFRANIAAAALDPFGATSPRSTNSSKTRPLSWTRSTSSGSAAPWSTRSDAGSSRTPPGTAAAPATPCWGSRPSCVPGPRTSPTSSGPAHQIDEEPPVPSCAGRQKPLR
jgi:hypothetical protein